MNNEKMLQMVQRISIDSKVTNEYTIQLTGELGSPDDYYEDFEVFRTAGPDDFIHLIINGPGGYVDTATQYIHAMRSSQATILGTVAGQCKSAHTFIFLNCHGFDIAPHSQFMCHDYSSGTIGKGSDQYASVVRDKEWYDAYTRDNYSGFLSEEEINHIVNNGKEFHFSPEQVLERCQNMVDARQEDEEAPEGTIDLGEIFIDKEVYNQVIDHYFENKEGDDSEEAEETLTGELVGEELYEILSGLDGDELSDIVDKVKNMKIDNEDQMELFEDVKPS